MQRTKLEKIVACYARIAVEIADVPDAWVRKLHRSSSGVAAAVERASTTQGAPKLGEIALGLEQGLRELPDMFGIVSPQWRPAVARAFRDAIAAEYPEFFERDAKRLEAILARGKIRNEREFQLIRHRVEALEGDPGAAETLEALYEMLGAFENR